MAEMGPLLLSRLLELTEPQGRYLATALADPTERIVARIISDRKMQLDLNWLKTRIRKAIKTASELMVQKADVKSRGSLPTSDNVE